MNNNNDHHDQRRHARIPREEILSIKLIAPPTEFAYQGEPLYCSTINLSASGLQIILPMQIDVDQKVDIWIVLLEDRGTLHLTGTATWIRPAKEKEEEGWLAGIALLPDESEDYDYWVSLFKDA